MTLSEKIQELSEIWGKCISGHHKSNDPIHYISIKYSFGNIEYIVEHSAYIGDDINYRCNTLRAAKEYLCRELIRQIEDQINNNLEFCRNPDLGESDKPEEYWTALQKTFESVRNIKCSDSPAQVNYEELYFDTKQKYEAQNYHISELEKILDFYEIPRYDDNYPEMEFSVNYRVEKLIEKLRNK